MGLNFKPRIIKIDCNVISLAAINGDDGNRLQRAETNWPVDVTLLTLSSMCGSRAHCVDCSVGSLHQIC
jgi:hypothetical protein